MSDDSNTTISFRLRDELHDVLVHEADLLGLTKHQLAKQLVLHAVERLDSETENQNFNALKEAIASLEVSMRLAFGRGIAAVLQDVSRKRDPEQIREWVIAKILTPSTSDEEIEGD